MQGFYIGDIIGNAYAHKNSYLNKQTKNFELFNTKSFISDETVFSFATIEWLINSKTFSTPKMKNTLKKYYYDNQLDKEQTYGESFVNWILTGAKGNRKSKGNDSATRVSPIGWFAKNEAQVSALVKSAVLCTHNSPEGIESALIIALSVFWLKNGMTKDELKAKLEKQFNLKLDETISALQKKYNNQTSAITTIKPAIISFLRSKDFEDAIRNAVAIGGDSDAIASMTASLAEAFYKSIPSIIQAKAKLFLPKKFADLEQQFNKLIEKNK